MSYRQIEDDDLLRRLFDAVVRLGQSREALLTGVPPAVSASLPVLRSRADTLWSDLNQLNQMGELLDGSVPLVTWLKNGVLLAGPRVEARVLQEALARVAPRPQTSRDDGAVPGRTTGAGDPTRRGGEVDSDPGRGFRAAEPPRTPAGGGARSPDAPLAVVLHAPQDDAFAAALRVHAAVLRNTNRARFWFEEEIDAGARRDVEIPRRIEQARVVLVLLSAAFLASDSMALVERALAEGRRVVPILARPCDWKSTAIGRLTTLPRNGVPIAQHASPDEAYVQIIGELRDLLERLPATDPPAAATPVRFEAAPARTPPAERVFPAGGHAAPAPGAPDAPMWAVRDAELFWPRQDVRALLKLLSNGYGANVQGLLEVALYAGIPSAVIAFHGRAVADVARDVVEQARTRGLVKRLLEELRKDERIGGFRHELDEMLGAPTQGRVAT